MKMVKQNKATRRGGYRVLTLTFDNGKVAEIDEEDAYKWLNRANAVYLGERFKGDVEGYEHNEEMFHGVTRDKEIVKAVTDWLEA